ncbi:putative disease resistance protein RGA1 isoform X2 [Mangifera indica]|uniref:putative disease resistance protein RGA1 isoform X2 n=1 Tax=Mangifera indica TaxID=29780 RepID=UPI001CFBF0BA|nr:putative disease resistance protein RGA1 isoform X2 [Mangifera indica]
MADGLVFDAAWKLLELLGSRAFQEVELASGVGDEIRKLKDTVETIKAVLLDAEEQHNKKNHQVTLWLRRLKDAFYDADDLLDDFAGVLKQQEATSEVRIFFSKFNQIAYSLKMAHKIKTIRKRLDDIAKDMSQFHFLKNFDERPIFNIGREQTHSFVREEKVIGRDDDKIRIIELLLESNYVENVSVIPIVGIGGIGKTTLAQLAYNDEKIINHFDLRMWACISDDFDVGLIVKKIIKSVNPREVEKLDKLEMDQLQKCLREEIDGKKYLLVLDDLWDDENPHKWSELKDLLMGGARDSKILVTTRNENVARITSKFPSQGLRRLDEDESWSLFMQIVSEYGIDLKCSELVAIGKDIIAKCAGVPLAIRTIGHLLCNQQTKSDWLQFRDSELSKIAPEGSGILPVLKLSYDHLPSYLKQCFAYCALFPKDYDIPRQKLICLWMAQGFLHSPNKNKCPEDVGNEYFMNLLSRSFFQDPEYDELGNITTCKMHDLMHDLAQSVAGGECTMATLDGENFNEIVHYVSFKYSDIDFGASCKIPSILFRSNHIRAISFPCNLFLFVEELNQSNFKKMLSRFKCLRSLNLSGSRVRELPSSIGKLKHLRYLDLSYNVDIKKLPTSLTRLRNLQTLDLSGCGINELPRDIEKMVGRSNGSTFQKNCELSELNGLNSLRGKLTIKNLEHMEKATTPTLAILEAKQYLQSLKLKWEPIDDNVVSDDRGEVRIDEILLEGLKPHPNLKRLSIFCFGGVKLSSWLSSITNLTSINLVDCERCQHIPPLEQLPYLKILSLRGLHDLEYVSDQGMDSSSCTPSTTFYQSLKELKLTDCSKLLGWWRRDKDNDDDGEMTWLIELPSFPCLSKLTINGCPKLTSMPLYPSLEELYLEDTSSKPLQQTMKLVTGVAVAPSTSSCFLVPLSRLKSMSIECVWDLEVLPEEGVKKLTALTDLKIVSCPTLFQLFRGIGHLISLQNIIIRDCHDFFDEDNYDMQWQGLRSLCCLRLSGLPAMESLPLGLQYVATLQHLVIWDCHNLLVLPEWMYNLTSLEYLEIVGCHNLIFLAEGMQLRRLSIFECPQLSKRYGNRRGDGWLDIAHIPNIIIDLKLIQKEGCYLLSEEGCSSP